MAESLEHIYKYREFLVQAYERAQAEFDKTLMAHTSGALAVMLLVVKDLGEAGGAPADAELFPLACGLLVLSLTLALVAQAISHRVFDREIRAMDDIIRARPERPWEFAERTRLREWTKRCNNGAFLTFLLGAVLMLVFAWANIGR